MKIAVYWGTVWKLLIPVGRGQKCLKSHRYKELIREDPERMEKRSLGGHCLVHPDATR